MTSSKHRGERETSSPGITQAANLGFEAGIGIALHTSIPNILCHVRWLPSRSAVAIDSRPHGSTLDNRYFRQRELYTF
jgi:hypothetical protein